jgi:hypothetical protein
MADRQIKVVGKHLKDCFAIKNRRKGTWPTEWGPIQYGDYGPATVTTERRYGKNGRVYRHWLVFVCNCTGCPARLHVEADFILAAAKKAMRSPSTNRATTKETK